MSEPPRKRVMIFGPYVAANEYARRHGLLPSQWAHGSSRERVMGLDPRQYEMAIVGSELDKETTEALREWEFRRQAYGATARTGVAP